MLPLEDARVLPGAKSGFLGVVYSFLLPGMGELYAGRFDRGRYPLITEGALWLSLVGVNMAGGWVRDDARVFAAQAAGVQSAGKDDQFFVDIGNYASLAEYNAARRVERSLDRLYPEDPAAGYGWTWRNAADREKYKDQRILSDGLYKATGFVVLGLIANRIWSGIQAAVAVKDYNNSLRASQSWLPAMQPEVMAYNGNANGIRFVFLKSF